MFNFHQGFIADKQIKKRFTVMLTAFFICLVLPLALIIYYAFWQFANEVEFQYQEKAVNIINQINKKLDVRVKTERKRPIRHYNFYQQVVNPLTGNINEEISPLAEPSNSPENIGLLGYFQINADKSLSTPLLPYQTKQQIARSNTELKWPEIERRLAIKEQIRAVLLKHNFVVNLANGGEAQPLGDTSKANIIKETFQVRANKNKYLVVFRNVWVNGNHIIQGFVAEQRAYLHKLIIEQIEQAQFASDLQIRFKVIHAAPKIQEYFHYKHTDSGSTLVTVSDQKQEELEQQYIHHAYIITPFQKIQLRFTTNEYPLGAVSTFAVFFIILLIAVLIFGCIGIYWLGIKQIEIAEQRMNFVSSVSHELKTPLTSISMYSEMLKSNMVTDPKTQFDYHEFIYNESGRLSRLISNILQLSSLNQQQEVINLDYVSIFSLKDNIRSKVSSLIDKNNFELQLELDRRITENSQMLVDLDAFSQIVINLVDNSVKFFNAANIVDSERRKIAIGFHFDKKSHKRVRFSVRDFGPGISTTDHERLFELFYREGNEMTRTTPGTGIGLALVNELVNAQQGKIRVQRRAPGVEFEILFSAIR